MLANNLCFACFFCFASRFRNVDELRTEMKMQKKKKTRWRPGFFSVEPTAIWFSHPHPTTYFGFMRRLFHNWLAHK